MVDKIHLKYFIYNLTIDFYNYLHNLVTEWTRLMKLIQGGPKVVGQFL